MDLGIEGRVALVLGSTSGLGKAAAQRLAAEGARVVVTGRRGALAQEIAEGWPGAVGVEVDLSVEGAVDALVDQVEQGLGPVDILVLNSPGPKPAPALDVAVADVERAVDVLLLRQVELVGRVLPGMRERGWGRIVGIGSSGIQSPIPRLALSNIARAGLAAYLKSLAADVAADGVTVNMVLPGRIATDRLSTLDRNAAEREGVSAEEVAAKSHASIPMRRYGRPEEFGDTVAFIASDVATYITGEQVRVDGGLVSAY